MLEITDSRSISADPVLTPLEDFASVQASARDMKVALPHVAAGGGTVNFAGCPLKVVLTPVTYHRAPPTCDTDTDCTIRHVPGDVAHTSAHAPGVPGESKCSN